MPAASASPIHRAGDPGKPAAGRAGYRSLPRRQPGLRYPAAAGPKGQPGLRSRACALGGSRVCALSNSEACARSRSYLRAGSESFVRLLLRAVR